MIGKLFKYAFMGILGLIALGVALAAVGLAIGLAVFALKVGVVVAIGYGVVKLIGAVNGKPKVPEISAEDRKWLES